MCYGRLGNNRKCPDFDFPGPYIANHSRCISFTVAKLNVNSLESIRGWTVVLYGQSLLHRLFHWKSFTVTNQSAKTTKLFHLKRFAIYGMIKWDHN